jgi:prepilin-type N-terminal cleavage/methylation domain-containing protein
MMIKCKQLCQQIKVANQRGVWMDFSQSSQSGFTIIESLVAVMVATILMAAIAPVITLSVATRVQARRVELGAQSARAYIDGVRSGAISPPKHVIYLNEVNSAKDFTPKRDDFAAVAAPSSTLPSCTTTTTGYRYCTDTTTSSLYCIDRDGGGCSNNSFQDLVVQSFRTTTNSSTTARDDADKGYVLGVRVYRADGFNGTALRTMKANNAKQRTFTGGAGDRKTPIVEITTEVASKKTKFQDYCTRFGGCK